MIERPERTLFFMRALYKYHYYNVLPLPCSFT